MNAKLLPVFAAALCTSGCMINTTPAGPMLSDSRSIPRDASESARVELRMSAGELRIGGGAPDFMRADFRYNVPSWKPDVRYTSAAGTANLTITQPNSGKNGLGNTKNDWDVRLSDGIPVDLTVHFGAGEARLNLGSLSLRNLEIEIGAGELDVDLRGTPPRDYDVRIRGGAGEATVHLPKDVGVYAKAEGGLGEINVRGLRKEGQHWVSETYDSAKVHIHVDVRGGVGQINLLAE